MTSHNCTHTMLARPPANPLTRSPLAARPLLLLTLSSLIASLAVPHVEHETTPGNGRSP